MNREEFIEYIGDTPIYLDGATGTNLQNAGMPTGVCPENWILEHRDVMIDLQKAYVEAGTNILLAPTFSGNRIKLEEYGLGDRREEINRELVKISKEASGGKALVAGDITMTGKQLYPMGDLRFEELVDIYKEQVTYMLAEDVDLFVIETMMSLAETRAAVIAIRELSDKAIIASMTYNEDGRTLYGTDPKTATIVLQSLGVDSIGVNCSTGPKDMIAIVEAMREVAHIPLMAKPNAGMPELIDGVTKYLMTPDEFASDVKCLIDAGVHIAGGCCGTTPDHIRALHDLTKDIKVLKPIEHNRAFLTSERQSIEIKHDDAFKIIGERINPTGKKKLQAELREGKLNLVMDMAEQQEESGAAILDVNMGMNGIDEKEMLLEVVAQVSSSSNLPLCIDSSHVDVIEAALRQYPGRALINSISLESEKFEKLLPIAKKYGAMFILLPLSDEGLPKNIDEKKAIIHKIMDRALELGIKKEDIVVDGLVATVGAEPTAAIDTINTIKYCHDELGLFTSCGLSNISFGLPKRINVNVGFLTMCIESGLTMAIANPNQEELVTAILTSDLLLNREGADIRYITRMNEIIEREEALGEMVPKNQGAIVPKKAEDKNSDKPPIYLAVLKGQKDRILDLTKQALDEGTVSPDDIINDMLIPAINDVGDLFNKKKYFLPQLIASAETMEKSIGYLEPMLVKKDTGEVLPTIIIATVEGDIHDIGKNLVALMLRNYGYNVIDLGKDVPLDDILKAADDNNAEIIALSALMTTTMMRMKDVVDAVKEQNLPYKVIIGGAVVTDSFAEEIGADGYSNDAADCVKLVESIRNK